MPGLDENFVVHNLVVEEGAIPIKQKPKKISKIKKYLQCNDKHIRHQCFL